MSGDSLLNVGGLTPVLDGVTPVFVLLGADPTVAPGFQAPPGSIGNFNGTYYWKFGATATQWVVAPFGGAGGLSPLTTRGDIYGFSTLGARIPVGTDFQFLQAYSPAALGVRYASAALLSDWSTPYRYYFLDYDGGNDALAGFLDGTAGATFTAGQAAAVAIKTVEQLYAILPQNGAGRNVVILQKPRAAFANYLDKDGVTQSNLDTSRYFGYRTFIWRGSSDHTNNAADKITSGFGIAVAGPNGDSSFTCAAGATTSVVPIAAGVIAAEGATQFRIRFLAATATAALRNICRVITSCVANTSVTTGNVLPATPGATDQFVIERPGVRMNQMNFDARGLGDLTVGGPLGPHVIGIGFTTSTGNAALVLGDRPFVCGCELTTSTTNVVFNVDKAQQFACDVTWFDEAQATVAVGMGLRIQCGSSIMTTSFLNGVGFGAMNTSATTSVQIPGTGSQFGSRSYFGGTTNVQGVGACGLRESGGAGRFGDNSTSNQQPRVVSGGSATAFSVFNGAVSLWRLKFENFAAATHGALYIKNLVGGSMNIDGCTSDGTPTLGGDFSGCWGATFLMGNTIANTVTGASGDIKLGGNGFVKHTDLTVVGFTDPQGNVIMGTAGKTSGQAVAVTNQGLSQIDVCSPLRIVATGNVLKSSGSSPGTALVDGVALSTMAASSAGYMVSEGPCKAAMEIAVVGSDLLYLSATTPATFTKTPPAQSGTNQLLRVGRALDSGGPGNVRMILRPELLAVTSDGVGP